MYDIIEHLGSQGVPLAFFGAVENHNTACGAAEPEKSFIRNMRFGKHNVAAQYCIYTFRRQS